MTFFPVITLRTKFEITEVGDECIAVSLAERPDEFHGVVKLDNESAKFMFEKLQKGITLPELIKACMDEYDDTPVEDAGPKVIEFLDSLKAQGLLAVDPKRGIRIEDQSEK